MTRALACILALALLSCDEEGASRPAEAGSGELVVPGDYLDVTALALSNEHVFWLEAGSGALLRSGKDGAGLVVLTAELFDPRGLVVGGDYAYFHHQAEGARSIVRVPIEGGEPDELSSTPFLSYPGVLALTGSELSWIEWTPEGGDEPSGVVTLSLEGGELARSLEWTAGERGFHLARDEERLCVSRELLSGGEPNWYTDVVQCLGPGDTEPVTVANDAWAASLALRDGNLYFTDPTDISPRHGAYRIAVGDGGSPERLLDVPWLDAVEVASDQLFVQDVAGQRLLAVDLDTGESRELSRNAAGGRFDGNLVADESHVYYATERGIERAAWGRP